MVPPDSDRAPPTPPYSGYGLGSQTFRVRGRHPLRRAFPGGFRYVCIFLLARPTTPGAPRRPRFGLAPFRSPLLGGSLLFSSPPATWMFRFAGFASAVLRMPRLPRGGLPHSDTRGSRAARASPRSFAACRVLLRLREPQASPVRPLSLVALVCLGARLARASLVCLRDAPPGARVLCVFLSSHPDKEPCGGPAPARVENVGLEPTTPGLQSRCSSRLSQSPSNVVPGRLELPTPTLSVWCSNRLSYGTPSGVPGTRPLPRLASPSY